jgi:hypothetical protein
MSLLISENDISQHHNTMNRNPAEMINEKLKVQNQAPSLRKPFYVGARCHVGEPEGCMEYN